MSLLHTSRRTISSHTLLGTALVLLSFVVGHPGALAQEEGERDEVEETSPVAKQPTTEQAPPLEEGAMLRSTTQKPDPRTIYTEEDLEAIEATKRPNLLDSFSLRVSIGLHGLAGSKQGRPLIYPDISARYKADRLYLDMRLPALLGGIDYGLFLLQRDVIKTNNAFMLFQVMNKVAQYVQGEAGLLRIGQTWSVLPGKPPEEEDMEDLRKPLLLSAGVAAIGDWAVMEARLLSEPLPEEASIQDLIITDPIVLGVGVFGAVAARRDRVYAELALMVARDLFQWDAYGRSSGFMFSPDAEVIVMLADQFGLYFRTRLTLYTHVKNPRAISIQSHPGVIVSF